ncbi:MAG: 50S ribosomal protein L11 methyltransferase [Bacteroidia bacterium]|nr:50S ribosomal protein L11 methyltransferase [Bacteroidia bacterium]
MKYIEVSFIIKPYSTENEELLIAVLNENNFDSYWQTENELKAYIPESLFSIENLQSICNSFQNNLTVETKLCSLPEKNWNEEWEKSYPFTIISDKCLIRAPFHTNTPKTDFDIVIEPKMSFGTGHHSTTSLMVELILEMEITNKIILDMGCGTGILAILSSLKNAKKITAIDFDEWAYENSIENSKKNNCINIDVIKGTAANIPYETYDIIFANINRNVLLEDIGTYNKHLKQNSNLVISGFLESDIDILWKKAEKFQLFPIKTVNKNNWVAAIFEKK